MVLAHRAHAHAGATLLGYPAVAPENREKLAVAVALAAARMERAAGAADATTGETGSRLSPWVTQHRARLRD